MKKIGLIVQRYGIEVNGGAEYHARVLAEKINKSEKYSVTVLTTKSTCYQEWGNTYQNSKDFINGVKVLRFNTLKKNHKKFRAYRRRVFTNRKHHQILRKLFLFNFLKKNGFIHPPSYNDGLKFIKYQGPYSPSLINYIKENKDNYDCFIFFTYLYYPSVLGLNEVGYKSIFIPTAHDEPLFYIKSFEKLFSLPKFIMYNTIVEKKLVEKTYLNHCKSSDIAGVGIEHYTINNNEVSEKFKFKFDYFVYIGRIDVNKGCQELINYFEIYSKTNNVKLVLVGKKNMDYSKKNNSIIFTGFVNESEKYHLLKNSKGLIIPSKYESLSLVTLESMIHNKIVIANKECLVLKDHIDKSKSGYLFDDYTSFSNSLNSVLKLSKNDYKVKASKGKDYVISNYSWEAILNKFDKAIEYITESLK